MFGMACIGVKINVWKGATFGTFRLRSTNPLFAVLGHQSLSMVAMVARPIMILFRENVSIFLLSLSLFYRLFSFFFPFFRSPSLSFQKYSTGEILRSWSRELKASLQRGRQLNHAATHAHTHFFGVVRVTRKHRPRSRAPATTRGSYNERAESPSSRDDGNFGAPLVSRPVFPTRTRTRTHTRRNFSLR